ncbi:MAG: MBL fold metallo-hydrolase, partial [Promethearchaeota archaeon]
MSLEEFKFSDKTILIQGREEIGESYKIRAYKTKLKYMEDQNVPQKSIKDLCYHFFNQNKTISFKTKNSILKIIFSHKSRILIVITSSGKELITNRDKLIKEYGWFFFVEKSEKGQRAPRKKKSKKKEEQKKERTIKTEEFNFSELIIPLKEKVNMRPLYHTKEYRHYLKLMKSEQVPQMPAKDVLDDFFNKDDFVPAEEKKAIRKIIYYQKDKVIVIKSLAADEMYENLENLVKKYGWYFYITGVPVGKSELCIAIDKIERKFNEDYFKKISLIGEKDDSKDIRVTIYPIVLKPNHNCHILGLGELNILLDCGLTTERTEKEPDDIGEEQEIQEEKDIEGEKERDNDDEDTLKGDMRHIDAYLQNLPQLIIEKEKAKGELSTENDVELPVKNIPQNPQIDAIFVSHSHWDHISGLKELIQLYPDIPILTSRITLDLFLLRDSGFLKQENHDEIEEDDYKNIIKNVLYVENGTKIEFKEKNCYLHFVSAGHMPGALMMLAKANDFRILYTGDYTYYDVTPFAGTRRFLEQISRPINYLLIDGTAAREDFGNISDQFHSLILFLEQKAEYGDNSLIGADPSSLAITFMLTFWRYFRKLQLRRGYKNRPNIYVDMMVRKNIQVINHRYEYIYGPISRLIRDKANPFNSIKFRWFDHNNLDFLRKKNNIIISHPPDLSY